MPPISSEAGKIRSCIATDVQNGRFEAADIGRRRLKVYKLAAHIREAVAAAPVPTPEEMERLRRLLRP